MKIKRIHVVRPEVQVEFKKPILGRLYFLLMLPKMIMVEKVKLNMVMNLLKDCEPVSIKPVKVYFIAIPKIKVGGAGD